MSAIVRPSGRRAGLPLQSEENATEIIVAAAVAATHTRYFQRWPVAFANFESLNNGCPAV